MNDDDCAVVRWQKPLLVVSTDYVNASPIALEFGIGDEGTVGRLAVAANLADLLGTGATPRCFLLSVVMPRESDVSSFRRLAAGVKAEAERWGVPVVGGDTKLGRAMAVCGVAIGEAESEEELFLKHRARAGHDVWVSGCLGSCSAAVLGRADGLLDEEGEAWSRSALTVPELPYAQSRAVAALKASCGGTDVSDGLGTDLKQMCDASGVGALIDLAAIPIHPQAKRVAGRMGVPDWAMAFGVGGEFQFLLTAPPDEGASLARAGLHRIGTVTADRAIRGRHTDEITLPVPSGGHRDGRRTTFAEEVRHLVIEASHGTA